MTIVPGPSTLRIGVHDSRPPATVRRLFPGAVYTRTFIPGVQRTPRSLVRAADTACRPSWSSRLVPVYSFKLDPQQVLAGKWDPYLRELASWHNSHRSAELVLWHEPENDPELRGGMFVRYFNHIAGVWRAKNIVTPLLYAAMAYQWLPGKVHGTVKGWTSRPADWQGVEADRHVIDAYSGQSVPLGRILPEHPGWQRWMEHIVGDGPWGVAERGFITATAHRQRAATIIREANWLRDDTQTAPQCRSYIYWNTSGTEGNAAIVLDAELGEPALRDLITVLV